MPGEQGLGKSLSVRKGDEVHLQVNARYETAPAQAPGIEGVATEVAGALQKTASSLESSGAGAGLNGATLTGALASGEDQGVPTAYLNYLLYDADYQLVDQGFVQVSEAAAVGKKNPEAAPEVLALDVDVKENGYLYAYLSHEATGNAIASSPSASSSAITANSGLPANGPVMNNGTPVHFDDFVVEHEGISIVQQDDYYAFGAPFRQQPSVGLKNKYLYQGKEWQSDLGLNLFDFHARQYDPYLGRMNSLDPMAAAFDGMSPYVGMGNNPTMYVDPNGEVIHIGLALLGGAAIGAGTGYLYGRSQGYTGWDMGYAMLGGAALGMGVAAGIHTGFFANVGTGIGNGVANAFSGAPGAIDQGLGAFENMVASAAPVIDGATFVGQSVLGNGGGGGPGPPNTLDLSNARGRQSYLSNFFNDAMNKLGEYYDRFAYQDPNITTGAPDLLGGKAMVTKIGRLKIVANLIRNGKGYRSFSAFKRAMGPAGPNKAWHHIVEQNPTNLAKFGPEAIHNTANLMKIPHGSGSIHSKVSGFYSSKQPFTNGMTVRQWVSRLSYDQQYNFGMKVLRRFGWQP